MAIYHLSARIISRGQGRGIIAAAAYRAGERLRDQSLGQWHDYTRKLGGRASRHPPPRRCPRGLG